MPKLLDPPRRRTPSAVPPAPPSAPAPADAIPPAPVGERAVFGGVTWERYVELGEDPAYDGCKLTFDAATGLLEIEMAQGPLHETVSRMLFLLVAAFRREHGIRVRSTGAVTLQRRDVGGLDPDESLYVTHVDEVPPLEPGVLDLNGGRRVPDLAMEVDISSPGVAKLPLYARLGVPEVWVWDHDADDPTARRLNDDGAYAVVAESGELPGFPLAAAAAAVREWDGADDGALEEAFLERLRGG